MKKSIIFYVLAAFLLFLFTNCGEKAQVKQQNLISSKVVFSIGDVKAKGADKWNAVMENMKLTQGSEIKTGSKSQCNIVIGNNSFITIKEKSHLIMETLFKDVAGIENNTVELKFGKTIVNPKKLLKGDSFRIKTPTAIAAVRGTKFVVQTNPQGKLKVAVVDGKVELKRRIPALEKVEKEIIEKSEVLTQLEKKVTEESIVIDQDQSAFMDNKKVEAENKVIEEVVAEHVQEIKEEIKKEEAEKEQLEVDEEEVAVEDEAKAEDEAKKREEEAKKKEERLKAMTAALAKLEIMKKEEEKVKVIIIAQKVTKEDIEDVKELDIAIKDAKEQEKVEVIEEKKVAVLTINSPVKKSAIYVNSKMVGYDTLTLNPVPGAKLKIEVVARGYEKFIQEVTLEEGEKKDVNIELIECAELTVISPVKNSKIFINSKFSGRNNVIVQPEAGEKLLVEVVARGYDKYSKEITLNKGEQKKLHVEFIEGPKLVIISPVRNSKIYIDSKYRGRNKVTVRPVSGKKINIEVVARGYKKYSTDLVLESGESKNLKIAMERDKKLDRVKWSEKVGKAVTVKPVYYKNLIIIGTNNGDLVAINKNGNTVWKAPLKRSIESTPAVYKGNVYVVTNSGDFFSIRLANGRIVWKKKIFGSLLFGSKPLIVKDMVFLATSYGRVYAYTTKGKELWNKNLENGIYASPAYSNGVIYIGAEDHYIYAISAKDGDIFWKFKADSRMVSSAPAVSGKTLLIGCYSGTFFAINSDNGELKWKYKTGDSVFSSPVVFKNRVYFGSNDGYLYVLSTDNGKLYWKFKTGAKIKTMPSIVKNIVYITSGKHIYALNINSGKTQWVHKFDQHIKTSATVVGNDIYLGLENGEVASMRNSLKDVRK